MTGTAAPCGVPPSFLTIAAVLQRFSMQGRRNRVKVFSGKFWYRTGMMTKVSGSKSRAKPTKTAAATAAATKTKYTAASEKSVSSVVSLASAKPKPAPELAPIAASEPTAKAASEATPKAAPEAAATTDSTDSVDAVSASPVLVTSTVPVVAGPELKKRELLARVATRSGVKKRDAKLVVEAMLAVMGEALAEGEELNLQPFGKLKINRVKESANGRILNCKLRQGMSGPQADKEGLAEADD